MSESNIIVVPYIKNGEKAPAEIRVDKVNWPDSFPYAPVTKAFLWHDGHTFHIRYEVIEDSIAAKATADNGEVWKDSCVEFFFAPDSNGYYNLESNCTGKILMSHRAGRAQNVEYAPSHILNNIDRKASLGSEPFECRKTSKPWTLELDIPASTFFKHGLKSFSGLEAKCNIYKCGDDLPSPHFLSYFPIMTEKPDFHRPEFFGTIRFE